MSQETTTTGGVLTIPKTGKRGRPKKPTYVQAELPFESEA